MSFPLKNYYINYGFNNVITAYKTVCVMSLVCFCNIILPFRFISFQVCTILPAVCSNMSLFVVEVIEFYIYYLILFTSLD